VPNELDRDPAVTPSLAEMASRAVELLSDAAGGRGFFLLIEGSKIDKRSHPNDGAAVLREALAYDEAVGAMARFAEADGRTLLLATSDHETGGLSLGRGAVVAPVAPPLEEGALRDNSLVAEAAGVVDRTYDLQLEVLANVSASSEAMVYYALAAVARQHTPSTPITCAPNCATGAATAYDPAVVSLATLMLTSPLLRDAFVGALRAALAEYARLEVRDDEVAFLASTVATLPQLGLYGCQRALGSIISARARLGWSSWGHSAVDVPVYSLGPSAQQFRGTLENTELGQRIASIMGWDLAAGTAALGPPLMAAADMPPPAPPG
jgi:alkaline phosphatase